MVLPVKVILTFVCWLGIANAQFFTIIGVQDGVGVNGTRPARLNINTLQNDPYAWPLYIQALTAMQNTAETTLISYFQISGIHGRPYTSWDNVNGPYTYTGYCTHDSVLFPTWHRPYLALLEQILVSQALQIALGYSTDRDKYQAAAQTLRLPYWDWAASAAIPSILSTPQITITKPEGSQLVNNPLYAYSFPPLDPTLFPTSGASDSFLANDPTTVRDPNANFNLQNAGLTQATYNLFSRISDYDTFATQSVSGSSLEAVHGTVHVYVGGNSGHMSYLSYAAFDPIFWLHHCNVDRIFALWQATHPNAFIPSTGLNDPFGTLTIAPNTQDFSSSSLTPFSSTAAGLMYTSDTARYMKTFGYTYPEISDWNQDPNQLAATVTAEINALYGPSGPQRKAARKKHSRDISVAKEKEWFVKIAINKKDLELSALVLIFLGDPPTDSSTYKGAENLAGSLTVFVPPNGLPDNYKSKTHGEVSLQAILEKAALPDYSEATVVAYLTKHLQWKIQRVDGTMVDLKTCPSLKIKVQSEDVTPANDEYAFPSYGKPKTHPDITSGKQGGYC